AVGMGRGPAVDRDAGAARAGDRAAFMDRRVHRAVRLEPLERAVPVRVISVVLERVGRIFLRARAGARVQRRLHASVAVPDPDLDSALAAARVFELITSGGPEGRADAPRDGPDTPTLGARRQSRARSSSTRSIAL